MLATNTIRKTVRYKESVEARFKSTIANHIDIEIRSRQTCWQSR